MIMHFLAKKGGRNTAIRVKQGSFEGTHVVQLVQYHEKHALLFFMIIIAGNRNFLS